MHLPESKRDYIKTVTETEERLALVWHSNARLNDPDHAPKVGSGDIPLGLVVSQVAHMPQQMVLLLFGRQPPPREKTRMRYEEERERGETCEGRRRT
jgi:hypothetical protein